MIRVTSRWISREPDPRCPMLHVTAGQQLAGIKWDNWRLAQVEAMRLPDRQEKECEDGEQRKTKDSDWIQSPPPLASQLESWVASCLLRLGSECMLRG